MDRGSGPARAGWVVSGIVGAILVLDAAMPFLSPETMRPTIEASGWSFDRAGVISAVALLCAVLYLVPATAVIGAILTTGFCGGAIATHARIDSGITPPMLVSLAIGVAAWVGLMLRDARLRGLLLPISSSASTRS